MQGLLKKPRVFGAPLRSLEATGQLLDVWRIALQLALLNQPTPVFAALNQHVPLILRQAFEWIARNDEFCRTKGLFRISGEQTVRFASFSDFD